MSIGYSLALERLVPSADVFAKIQDLVGGEFIEPGNLVVPPDLWIWTSPITHPLERQVFLDGWGKDMRTAISFTPGYRREFEQGAESVVVMLVLAVRLAIALDTDAGLSFETDEKVMRRSDGVVYLYRKWPEWQEPELLDQLPAPYVFTDEATAL